MILSLIKSKLCLFESTYLPAGFILRGKDDMKDNTRNTKIKAVTYLQRHITRELKNRLMFTIFISFLYYLKV